jgi:hypothetical protein
MGQRMGTEWSRMASCILPRRAASLPPASEVSMRIVRALLNRRVPWYVNAATHASRHKRRKQALPTIILLLRSTFSLCRDYRSTALLVSRLVGSKLAQERQISPILVFFSSCCMQPSFEVSNREAAEGKQSHSLAPPAFTPAQLNHDRQREGFVLSSSHEFVAD